MATAFAAFFYIVGRVRPQLSVFDLEGNLANFFGLNLRTKFSSSGTRDKRSSTSLLGIVCGLISLRANLLTPKAIIRYRIGIKYKTTIARNTRNIASHVRNGTVKLNTLEKKLLVVVG